MRRLYVAALLAALLVQPSRSQSTQTRNTPSAVTRSVRTRKRLDCCTLKWLESTGGFPDGPRKGPRWISRGTDLHTAGHGSRQPRTWPGMYTSRFMGIISCASNGRER